jgi:hypothetical protein
MAAARGVLTTDVLPDDNLNQAALVCRRRSAVLRAPPHGHARPTYRNPPQEDEDQDDDKAETEGIKQRLPTDRPCGD